MDKYATESFLPHITSDGWDEVQNTDIKQFGQMAYNLTFIYLKYLYPPSYL